MRKHDSNRRPKQDSNPIFLITRGPKLLIYTMHSVHKYWLEWLWGLTRICSNSAVLRGKVSPAQGFPPSRFTPPQLHEGSSMAIWPLQTQTGESALFPTVKWEVNSSVFSVFVVEMCIPGNGLFLTLPLNLSYVSGPLFQENFKRGALL